MRSCSWHYGPACGKLLRGKSRLRPGPRFVVTTGIRPERVGTIRVQLTPSRRPDSRPGPAAHLGRGSFASNVRVSSEVSRRTERAVLCARHVAVVDRRHPRGGPHSSCSDCAVVHEWHACPLPIKTPPKPEAQPLVNATSSSRRAQSLAQSPSHPMAKRNW